MEDAVAVALQHARVDVEAAVPELGDLFREQLNAVHGIAEDDGLVDLQLGEEGVEAVDLVFDSVGGWWMETEEEEEGKSERLKKEEKKEEGEKKTFRVFSSSSSSSSSLFPLLLTFCFSSTNA